MRIAVAGSGRLAAGLIGELTRTHHRVVAVLQNGRAVRGFRRTLDTRLAGLLGNDLSVLCWARRLGAPVVWLDKQTDEELAPLRALRPDLLLVGGYSIILKRPTLDIATVGSVNVHSSLLPRHRGPNPFQSVIMQGEKESGVTYHVIEEGIDTGGIIEQATFPLEPLDTMMTVYRRSCDLAHMMVTGVMDGIERDGIHPRPQDESLASYNKKAVEADSWIDWRWPAEKIDRLVRALVPIPMPRFLYEARVVQVMRVRWSPLPVDAAPGTVLALRPAVRVATGLGTVDLVGAFTKRPVPWIWPPPWSGLKLGDQLPVGKGDAP